MEFLHSPTDYTITCGSIQMRCRKSITPEQATAAYHTRLGPVRRSRASGAAPLRPSAPDAVVAVLRSPVSRRELFPNPRPAPPTLRESSPPPRPLFPRLRRPGPPPFQDQTRRRGRLRNLGEDRRQPARRSLRTPLPGQRHQHPLPERIPRGRRRQARPLLAPLGQHPRRKRPLERQPQRHHSRLNHSDLKPPTLTKP